MSVLIASLLTFAFPEPDRCLHAEGNRSVRPPIQVRIDSTSELSGLLDSAQVALVRLVQQGIPPRIDAPPTLRWLSVDPAFAMALSGVSANGERLTFHLKGQTLRKSPDWSVVTITLTCAGANGSMRLAAWDSEIRLAPTEGVEFRPFLHRSLRLARVMAVGTDSVWMSDGVSLDSVEVAHGLRFADSVRALVTSRPRPPLRFVVGRVGDSTMSFLGMRYWRQPMPAATSAALRTVFGPATRNGGLDRHELVHGALIGAATGVPDTRFEEGIAVFLGGGRQLPFPATFCAHGRPLNSVSSAELLSVTEGRLADEQVRAVALGALVELLLSRSGPTVLATGLSNFQMGGTRDDRWLALLALRLGVPLDELAAQWQQHLADRIAACADGRSGL